MWLYKPLKIITTSRWNNQHTIEIYARNCKKISRVIAREKNQEIRRHCEKEGRAEWPCAETDSRQWIEKHEESKDLPAMKAFLTSNPWLRNSILSQPLFTPSPSLFSRHENNWVWTDGNDSGSSFRERRRRISEGDDWVFMREIYGDSGNVHKNDDKDLGREVYGDKRNKEDVET